MIDKLKQILSDYNQLSLKMSEPDIVSNIQEYTKLAKEHRRLSEIIPEVKHYISIYEQIEDDEEILKGDDKELKEIVKECLVEILAEGLTSSVNSIQESRGEAPRKKTKSRKQDRISPDVFQKRNKMLHEKTSSPPAANVNNETISNLTDDPMMQAIFADTAQTTLLEQKVGEGKRGSYVPVDAAQKMVYDSNLEDLFEGSQNWAALAFSDDKK